MAQEFEQQFIAGFNALASHVHDWARAKGFWDKPAWKKTIEKYANAKDLLPQDLVDACKAVEKEPDRNMGEMIMLKVTELAEGVEGHRKGNPPDQHCPEFTSLEVELADALIRIADTARGNNLRVAEAAIAKMQYNQTRPHKHGKNY